VGKRLAEETVQQDGHLGLQRARLHAYGHGEGLKFASGEHSRLLVDTLLLVDRIKLVMRA
jgi:hypothetical protein